MDRAKTGLIETYRHGTFDINICETVIPEIEIGAFKQGQKIYLTLPKFEITEGTAEVTKGDLQIGDLKIRTLKEGGSLLIIPIVKESTQASEITLKNIQINTNIELTDGAYSLNLITKNTPKYPDNLLSDDSGSFDEIPIVSRFVVISDLPFEDSTAAKYSGGRAPLFFSATPGSNVNHRTEMEAPSYVSDKGYIMIPISAVTGTLDQNNGYNRKTSYYL